MLFTKQVKKITFPILELMLSTHLRMEKAYRGWGAELTGEISLVEAGMDRFFNLNKKSNFIGSEILRDKAAIRS